MNIDERLVVTMPKTFFTDRSPRSRKAWINRSIMRAVYKYRCKVMEETGEDIFNVFVYNDYVEINLKGEFETTKVK